jgi:hypothetical protein
MAMAVNNATDTYDVSTLTVATFIAPSITKTAGDFSATIAWGDGPVRFTGRLFYHYSLELWEGDIRTTSPTSQITLLSWPENGSASQSAATFATQFSLQKIRDIELLNVRGQYQIQVSGTHLERRSSLGGDTWVTVPNFRNVDVSTISYDQGRRKGDAAHFALAGALTVAEMSCVPFSSFSSPSPFLLFLFAY